MKTYKALQSVKVGPFAFPLEGEIFQVQEVDDHIHLLVAKGLIEEIVPEAPVPVEVEVPAAPEPKKGK